MPGPSTGSALKYPYVGMCFVVSAASRDLGVFSECSGLTVEVGSDEYREGGVNHFVHKLPTHVATTPLVLKRGLDDATGLWDWINEFVDTSKVKPEDITIALTAVGSNQKVLRSWVVNQAFPLKWEGPQFDANKGAVAFESVELGHRGITVGSS